MGKRPASLLAEADDEFTPPSNGIFSDENSLGTNANKKRGGRAVTRKTTKKADNGVLGEIDGNIRQLGMGALSVLRDMSPLKADRYGSGYPLGRPALLGSLDAGIAPQETTYASALQVTKEGRPAQGSLEAGIASRKTTFARVPQTMGEGSMEQESLEAGIAPEEANPDRAPWVAEDWIQTLFKSTDKSALKNEVRQFVAEMRQDINANLAPMASEEIEDFLDGCDEEWASHCPELDEVWEKYAPRLAKISGCELSELVKPSGPLCAYLGVMWHYPTNSTAKMSFGMVMDPSNPYLRIQKTKIGMSRQVLTYDAFPLRMDRPKAGNPYDNGRIEWWEEFKTVALELQVELRQHTKLRIVLGKENNDSLEVEMRGDEFTTVTSIDILLNGKSCTIYKRKARIFILQEKSTRKIRQIVLPSYHLEYFYHKNVPHAQSQLCDTVWNFAGAVMGFEYVNINYFTWKMKNSSTEPVWDLLAENSLIVILRMVAWEESHGPITEETVRHALRAWLSKAENLLLLDPAKGTLAKQIHMAMLAKGRATIQSEVWQSSKGKQRMLAGSAKGTATRQSEAWLSSGGREKLIEASAKGRATIQSEAWQSSEGKQLMLAGLAKGAVTMQSEAWQSSEGKQRKLAGVAKSVATRQSEAWLSSGGRQKLIEASAKGRITQKSDAWQSSEGKQKQLEGSAKGRATLQSEAWQSSEGKQRLLAGVAKSVATRHSEA